MVRVEATDGARRGGPSGPPGQEGTDAHRQSATVRLRFERSPDGAAFRADTDLSEVPVRI